MDEKILAKRVLQKKSPNNESLTADVVVEVFFPREVGEMDFVCHFKISGLKNERAGFGAGVDAIQALMLALTNIGTYVYGAEEAKAGLLAWNHDPNLGFPVFSKGKLPPDVTEVVELFM